MSNQFWVVAGSINGGPALAIAFGSSRLTVTTSAFARGFDACVVFSRDEWRTAYADIGDFTGYLELDSNYVLYADGTETYVVTKRYVHAAMSKIALNQLISWIRERSIRVAVTDDQCEVAFDVSRDATGLISYYMEHMGGSTDAAT